MLTRSQLKLIGFTSFTDCEGKDCTKAGSFYNTKHQISYCQECLEVETRNPNSDYYIEQETRTEEEY